MIIKQGTILAINDSRKGKYVAQATEDFDTEKDEWYPLALYQDEPVYGLNTTWSRTDSISARKGLVKIKVMTDEEAKPYH